MVMPLVFVGAATYDAISLVPRYPSADERVEADDLVFAGGGPAATAAVAAHRLGADTALIAPIGDDRIADLVEADLEREGIGPSHLQRTTGRRTQASAIVCSADIAARAITTQRVEPFHLSEANARLVREAEWVHVDHLGWPAVEEVLAGVPDAERPSISVDAGHPVIGDRTGCRSHRTALFVPPWEKLEHPELGAREALSRTGAERAVATRGGDGAVGLDLDGTCHTVPGFEVGDFGSTLGAGDVFHGALVAAVHSGRQLLDSMRLANVVAALSCRGIDGRSRIPDLDEAEQLLRSAALQAD